MFLLSYSIISLLCFLTIETMEFNGQTDDSKDFAKPALKSGRYDNPKSFNNWHGLPGPISIAKWKLFEVNNEKVPKSEEELSKTIPVHTLTKFESVNKKELFASWLGHATVLVQIEGVRMITDPIWASKASFSSLVGPERYRPPPMKIEDLPQLDIGVISHDHYDHLDADAVKKISDQNPSMHWFVPLGMEGWMKSINIHNTEDIPDRVKEMNWGDNTTIKLNGKDITIWCLPAQHWGQRGPFDRNWRLWSGWAVIGPKKRFYYSGDTGFCDKEFKKIGDKLGPFDLSAIPIGAYEPRWFMQSQHINPEEAVEMHRLIRSKYSIGIHWGTYHMGSYEFYLEPRDKLEEIMKSRTEIKTKFVTIPMGKIWEEDDDMQEA